MRTVDCESIFFAFAMFGFMLLVLSMYPIAVLNASIGHSWYKLTGRMPWYDRDLALLVWERH